MCCGPCRSGFNVSGNESWFHAVSTAPTSSEQTDAFVSACSRGLPFSAYTSFLGQEFSVPNNLCSNIDQEIATSNAAGGDVSRLVARGVVRRVPRHEPQQHLDDAGRFANEALLTITADGSRADSGRPIFVSSGKVVVKPTMHLVSKIIVSVLLLVEVVALVSLAVFIYRVLTFASRLDAIHIAAIGAQLAGQGEELPLLGPRARGPKRDKCMKGLEDVDGLIGVEDEGVELTTVNTNANATMPHIGR